MILNAAQVQDSDGVILFGLNHGDGRWGPIDSACRSRHTPAICVSQLLTTSGACNTEMLLLASNIICRRERFDPRLSFYLLCHPLFILVKTSIKFDLIRSAQKEFCFNVRVLQLSVAQTKDLQVK